MKRFIVYQLGLDKAKQPMMTVIADRFTSHGNTVTFFGDHNNQLETIVLRTGWVVTEVGMPFEDKPAEEISERRTTELLRIVRGALKAMSDAFDCGQQVGTNSAIYKCRRALSMVGRM